MKFKSKLAQAAYDEIMGGVYYIANQSEKCEATARAIEVAAKIEIEEARNHTWSEPITGTVEEKAECVHEWMAGKPHEGLETCALCGVTEPQ